MPEPMPGDAHYDDPTAGPDACTYCASATSNLRVAADDSEVVAWCSMHACGVIVGQQKGPGPGLFKRCGKPHTVAQHSFEEATDVG